MSIGFARFTCSLIEDPFPSSISPLERPKLSTIAGFELGYEKAAVMGPPNFYFLDEAYVLAPINNH